jgi:hypothetical protein
MLEIRPSETTRVTIEDTETENYLGKTKFLLLQKVCRYMGTASTWGRP